MFIFTLSGHKFHDNLKLDDRTNEKKKQTMAKYLYIGENSDIIDTIMFAHITWYV